MRGIQTAVLAMLACLPTDAQLLPGTQPLTTQGDLAMQMVDGIDRYLMRELNRAKDGRTELWKRTLGAGKHDYTAVTASMRMRLWEILGLKYDPIPARFSIDSRKGTPIAGNHIATGRGYKVFVMRWDSQRGVEGEGLLLEPDRRAAANVIAIPDCDMTPEMLVGLWPGVHPQAQYARRLAETGCRVLVPYLIDGQRAAFGRMGRLGSGLPQREFLYRAGFELGSHLIGYEVAKVLTAITCLNSLERDPLHPSTELGLIGYGEGGHIAFYAAAFEGQIDCAVISGYFGDRARVWEQPIYRNLFGLHKEFGDAEIALTTMARSLIIEASVHPFVHGPPTPRNLRNIAAPGKINTPDMAEVRREYDRIAELTASLPDRRAQLIGNGNSVPGSDETLKAFLKALSVDRELARLNLPLDKASLEDPQESLNRQSQRGQRQYDQIVRDTQVLLNDASKRRSELWQRAESKSAATWTESTAKLRDHLWEKVIGKLPKAEIPLNARSRTIHEEPKYRGYEVVLDVYPDVFAYGILLVPKDIKEGEKRPVVVCQHGLEGRPTDVADPKLDHPAYHRFACRLAERGFVVFAPQNPYIGGDKFRVLQRKANPLGLSLFSFITAQHQRILEWLGSLPFVDSKRIGFYGLSYGGKTAMRVPALLEGYCLSICSADYNEWIWKNASATSPYSYLFTGEYEMPEWNLGNTFNYAEMSWLIAPRPFMVERGHHDGVAPDEWVAYEYARTKRKYVELGIGDQTEIEVFNGPHTINGIGTVKFLHKHLNWPAPTSNES